MSGVTPKYAIPFFSGSDIGNTMDDTDHARAVLLDQIIATSDQGAIGSRPVSTPGSPGKPGRFYKDSATSGALYYDYGIGWIGIALAENVDFNAVTSIDIPVRSTDRLLTLEYAIETYSLPELRMTPNADTSSVYSDVRDGSYLTNDGVNHAIAATGGGWHHNNGLRLAWPPQGSVAGGSNIAGRATLALGAARRTCVAQASVISLVGSANHAAEVQNMASAWDSAAAVTFVRVTVSSGAGTMTGRMKVSSL